MPENRKATVRLRETMHAYLVDLAKLGPYGKGKAGVMRRFIENGIVTALEAGAIQKRDVRDLGETVDDKDDGDDDDASADSDHERSPKA